jgi:hypothetical protein
MDPVSIIAGSATLLGSVIKISLQVTQFVDEVHDASNEMSSVSRELDSLSAPLTQLKNDASLVASLRNESGLQDIMRNCDQVLGQMSLLMRKVSTSRTSSMRWAISGRAEMAKLRSTLETYKSALVIVLNVHMA